MGNEIHNAMEDLVAELLDEVAGSDPELGGLLGQPQNRIDVLCYVLNRTQPVYIVSDRGLVHMQVDDEHRRQLSADLVARIYEGVRRVRDVQRKLGEEPEAAPAEAAFFFQFPAIAGRLFNGANLEPVTDVAVELLRDGRRVAMVNRRWANPYIISDQTAGSFVFWPRPEPAQGPGAKLIADFELAVGGNTLQPLRHTFRVTARSTVEYRHAMDFTRTQQLGDLFVAPVAVQDPHSAP